MSGGSEPVAVEVPDIGDFEDVPIIEIHVAPGDTVGLDDPLLTLESDKATMDVPSPFAGEVVAVEVAIGDRVSQGSRLLTLAPAEPSGSGPRAAAAASDGAPSEAAAPDAVAAALDSEPPTGDAAPSAPAPAPASAPGPGPAASAPAPAPASAPAEAKAPSTGLSRTEEPIYASPSVRRSARERGIDLRAVDGSGRGGRITAEDLDRPDAEPSGTAAFPGLDLAPWPKVNFEKYGPVERVPRTRIQRISAPNLARNWVMIPHVTHHDEADITDLEAWRKELNTEGHDVKVTMVSFLILASVRALQEFPDFNASLDGEELVRKRYFHIGFAADTPQGLVVPVIRDADQKGLLKIAAELGALSATARAGKLGPNDITGGTFSISSLGGIGGTAFTPIVNAPEVAILGATRAAIKPVWDGAQFVPRLMLPLSLSYDHRVVDGAAAARFTAFLVRTLSDFRRVLL